MRSAFSMIMAISVIVIMATVAMFVTNLSSKSVKATTVQYQRAQAMLYAKSYTEFAILAVTAHDRAADCVETIKGSIGNINQGGYAIHTHIAYIGPATITLPDGTIENNIVACPANLQLSTNVTTTSTPLTLIIDAYVHYKDPDNTDTNLTVHRRTVQKI